MRRLMPAIIVVTSLVLGATVFRSEVVSAAQQALQVFVTNDAANPVPVTQQGTANVNVTNAALLVRDQGARLVLVAKDFAVPVLTPVQFTSPWIDITDCAHIGIFERATFSFAPTMELSADGTRVDATAGIATIGTDVDHGTGWVAYSYPLASGVALPKARVHLEVTNPKTVNDYITAMWLSCTP